MLRVGIAIEAELADSIPPRSALLAGVGPLFAREYGRFAEISFDAAPPVVPSSAGPASAGPVSAAGAGDVTAQVTLSRKAGAIGVSTDLTRGRQTRSLSSSVPAGAFVSLVSTIAGDLAFLLFSFDEFSAFPLAAPPPMVATLQTDTLQILTGWEKAELEPIGLSAGKEEVTICFPHRFLTLDPRFRITGDTIRDIHAQASARDQLQLSGIAAGSGDEMILLSEREGRIARVNPRLGTRQVVAAPGLPGLSGFVLDSDTLAVPSNADGSAGILIFGLSPPGRWVVPIPASYVSALSRDAEGNLWAWDAGERRIRILTAGGREVFSIRPLFTASTMQLPQQLEVFNDGSFLLGGSAEVWKFESSGIPVWRLTHVPGRPAEKLPPSFALAAQRADGTFTLLDAQSRRVMTFASGAGASSATALTLLLSEMDGRNQTDVRQAAGLARGEGLSLMAWQYGDLLARRGGGESERVAARRAILGEKSSLYAELADSLARELLFAPADVAYVRAGESARELSAEAPDDESAARLQEKVLSRRQEVRAGLSRQSDVRIASAAAAVGHEGTCALSLTVMMRIGNTGPTSLARLRVHVCLPSISPSPSLVAIDALLPGEERDVELQLGLEEPLSASALDPAGIPAAVLVTYERGGEGFSVPASLTVQVADMSKGQAFANTLSCSAEPGDQLAAGLADDLLDLTVAAAGAPDALSSLAGILESLGGLRSLAVKAGAIGAPGARPIPAGAAGSVRTALRGLSQDERDWTLVALSIGASLGLPVGLMSWPDRVVTLVDTGIPLSNALSSLPELARFNAVLKALSREGRLCVPLSARPSPSSAGAVAWALVDALTTSDEKGVGRATIVWPDTLALRTPRPVPVCFPFPLPALPIRPSRAALRTWIIQALENKQ